MENVLSVIVMAAVSLPVSLFIARGCLKGVVRIVTGPGRRDVL